MTNALQDELNRANPNNLADALRRLNLGDLLRHLPVSLTAQAPGSSAGPGQLATISSIQLPGNAKCGAVLRAFARTSGNSVLGELTIDKACATPATGCCAVAPNGDIAFLAADELTSVDVVYQPLAGHEMTLTLPCVSSVMVLPTNINVLALVSAVVVTGTTPGATIVLAPGVAPATTKANLNAAHTEVLFNVATDLVTEATVTVVVASSVDPNVAIAATYP